LPESYQFKTGGTTSVSSDCTLEITALTEQRPPPWRDDLRVVRLFQAALHEVVFFSKQRQLGRVGVGDEAFAGGFGDRRLAGCVEFGFFEVFEDFLGAGDDRVGEAG